MIIANIIGFLIIAFVVWWFWLWKPKQNSLDLLNTNEKTVVVENGVYEPSHIVLPEGKSTEIIFFRKDPSPCAETLIFPALSISHILPLNKKVKVEIPPQSPGTFRFSCQMNMYRGELEIVSRH